MRKIAAIMLAGAAATAVTAQEPEPEEELSELERLSRSADDPFAGVIDAEEREPISVTLRALDKITARYTDLEVEMHQIVHFGSLEIQPRYCDKRPPEEFPETSAFLEIFDTEYGNRQSDLKIALAEPVEEEIVVEEIDILAVESAGPPPPEMPLISELPAPEVLEGPQAEGVNIFRGWMFASSPALNPLEHSVYDVWVIDCRTRIVES